MPRTEDSAPAAETGVPGLLADPALRADAAPAQGRDDQDLEREGPEAEREEEVDLLERADHPEMTTHKTGPLFLSSYLCFFDAGGHLSI